MERLSLNLGSKGISSNSKLLMSTGRKFFSNGPLKPPQYRFAENPIIFNKINERFVVKGKERIVGLWLVTLSASVFSIVLLGGYTRLSRSGLSMVKWHPHRVGLPKN